MADNRRRLLFVKRFFEEYTDDDHSATMYEIRNYLSKNCGIEAERKSITEDIYALQDSGMDIYWEENEKQRRLRKREFDISEIKMIIDCVASSKALSEEQSNKLIEK